jgi:hypothetical protein
MEGKMFDVGWHCFGQVDTSGFENMVIRKKEEEEKEEEPDKVS